MYGPSSAPVQTDMDGNPVHGPTAAGPLPAGVAGPLQATDNSATPLSSGDAAGDAAAGPQAPVIAQFIPPDPEEEVTDRSG